MFGWGYNMILDILKAYFFSEQLKSLPPPPPIPIT
jgi:hypothetical protein